MESLNTEFVLYGSKTKCPISEVCTRGVTILILDFSFSYSNYTDSYYFFLFLFVGKFSLLTFILKKFIYIYIYI